MSFNEKPLVDRSSERSEESVLKTKSWFKRTNGFLSREEFPDYGVDLDVELLINSGTSGFKFAIQIKSCKKVTKATKNNNEYISLKFSTSRLGYLMRRPPGYGIVIIYDTPTEICYFDYVEDIIKRITEQKQSEKWKSQKDVYINIPTTYKISETTIKELFEKMSNRYNSHNLLLNIHGKNFKIPVPILDKNYFVENYDLDFNDNVQIVDYLTKKGWELVNNQKFNELFNLISNLSFLEVNKSTVISFLAAITYSELGRIIDADYFLAKCELKINDYSALEIENIRLIRLRVDFTLGRLSLDEYLTQIRAFQKGDISLVNCLNIEVTKLYVEVIDILKKRAFNKSFEDLLETTFNKIIQLKTSNSKKYQILLAHTDTIFNYVSSRLSKDVAGLRISSRANQDGIVLEFPNDTFSQIPFDATKNILKYSVEDKDDLLRANALLRKARYFYRSEFKLFLLNRGIPTLGIKALYEEEYNGLKVANEIFKGKHLFQSQQACLSSMYDLILSFELIYKRKLAKDKKEDIIEKLRKIEKESGLAPFESIIKEHYINILHSPNTFEDILIQSSDEAIEYMALSRLDNQKLPKERLGNIIEHYKKMRYIYTNRSSEVIEVYFNVGVDEFHSNDYSTPVLFFLRNKINGYKTINSVDVVKLLRDIEENGM